MGLFSRKSKKEKEDFNQKKIKKSFKTEEKEEKKIEKKEDKNKYQDNKKAYKLLIKPIISEKATIGVSQGKYVFEVSFEANKVEIKKAINEIYGVKPIKVNIINNLGKKVRFGRRIGKQKDTRKAIITLKKGETINLYEGI